MGLSGLFEEYYDLQAVVYTRFRLLMLCTLNEFNSVQAPGSISHFRTSESLMKMREGTKDDF